MNTQDSRSVYFKLFLLILPKNSGPYFKLVTLVWHPVAWASCEQTSCTGDWYNCFSISGAIHGNPERGGVSVRKCMVSAVFPAEALWYLKLPNCLKTCEFISLFQNQASADRYIVASRINFFFLQRLTECTCKPGAGFSTTR